MRSVGLLAIKAYQRFLSPYKGFSCAYRAQTGGQSCSALGYRAVRRYGLLRGMIVLDKRFARCAAANERRRADRRVFHSQRGDCVPCDVPCDLPACDLPLPGPRAADIFNCSPSPCDCCDWSSSRKKSRDGKEAASVPPEKPSGRKKRGRNVSGM
jgi:uncharacterized protein